MACEENEAPLVLRVMIPAILAMAAAFYLWGYYHEVTPLTAAQVQELSNESPCYKAHLVSALESKDAIKPVFLSDAARIKSRCDADAEFRKARSEQQQAISLR